MTASKRLRALLRAANIEYDTLGDYYTTTTIDGRRWVLRDNYDGTLALNLGGRYRPEDAVDAIRGRVETEVHTVADEDGVGYSTCGACGRTVGEWFDYCPWCGARFREIVREHK